MPPITFVVSWSSTASDTFKHNSTESVRTVVQNIKTHITYRLDESDAQGNLIDYVLYRDNHGNFEPIISVERTLGQAGIRDGDLLYLASRQSVPTWKLPLTGSSTRTTGIEQTNTGPSLPKNTNTVCQLRLAPSCVISLSSSEGAQIDRAYLLQKLPASIVLREHTRMFLGFSSRLHSVSRDLHCQIMRQEDAWVINTRHSTYIYGRMVTKKTIALTESTTVVVGRNGWPIEIVLRPIS